ncbi:biopolymer transport protein ExbD [Variibacter gotjawalensis]|uniref:Biopolymer transport protein ExbD n=1 Tax=Variibacter gotjawalensis TaxID=1333996 RepID=A0A0S3PZN6_9BRAD|nr:TonB system transport protein ExbD [Variibacter gotjawalensis]NIK47255.1 biopolymer transport protein ExbD [Variibacter gotjawalensis]RZS49155.1 outer membrane transport energization protein ExbD [Variibacter gotjawalensis]BAT61417.1 biopolymer transport protein ExbD [Variibacter gotjawalensis]
MGTRLEAPSDDLAEVSEINVTPFIDVMLVLLIIFMIAAPLATVDIAVDLPGTNAQRQPRPDKPIFLTIKRDKTVALGEEPITRGQIGAAVSRVTNGDRKQRIFVRADKSVPYGEMMDVMNALRAAGYLKVALVALENSPGT